MGTIREYVKKDGSISYHAEVRLRGYPPQRDKFRTKTLAKEWIQDIESAIRDGRHIKTSESRRHTVKEMIDRFINQHLSRFPKRLAKQKCLFDWWSERFGGMLLANLTPSLIAEARDSLLSGITLRKSLRSSSTVNRYLAALSKALTISVKEWGWIEDSPMRKVTKPVEGRGRDRFLSLDEKKRLLTACKSSSNPLLYPIVRLALLSGMRQGEILNLRYECIDSVNHTITLQETKNGERRVIPLTADIAKVLREVMQVGISSGLLFHSSRRNNKTGRIDIRKAFLKALRIGKIENFRFHDLRHTAASYLAMEGATQGELMAILGHKTPRMSARYAHFSQQHISPLSVNSI